MAGAARPKLDGGIPNRLADAAAAEGALERDGYDGGWTAETNHDPFFPLLLAAEHTTRLELGTNIAVAFARNPMIVANIGWDLRAYAAGRFNRGLGTQIRPHIEKRFGMPWSHPARRVREFVSALHAIWNAWQDGSRLAYRPVLELHGWGDLQTELHRLSLDGEWDTMGSLIDDEMLAAFAVAGPVETVAAAPRSRCAGSVDRVLPIFMSATPACVLAALREFRE